MTDHADDIDWHDLGIINEEDTIDPTSLDPTSTI